MIRTPKNLQSLLSATEAAALIGITRAAVHYAAKRGLLNASIVGGRLVVARAEAIRYRDARENRPGPRKQPAKAASLYAASS